MVLFDSSQSHYASWLDSGVLVGNVLRKGMEKALAGTYIILITRDEQCGNDHWGLVGRTAGPAECEIVDEFVTTSRDHHTVLRVDLLKVRADSADPRVLPRHRGAMPCR